MPAPAFLLHLCQSLSKAGSRRRSSINPFVSFPSVPALAFCLPPVLEPVSGLLSRAPTHFLKRPRRSLILPLVTSRRTVAVPRFRKRAFRHPAARETLPLRFGATLALSRPQLLYNRMVMFISKNQKETQI